MRRACSLTAACVILAAERYQGAEPFFTAAGSLSVVDMRWPYYLGHVYKAIQQPEKAAVTVPGAEPLC